MAVQLDPSGKDDKNDIKTHFVTREGVYRILNLSSEEFLNPRPRPGVGYQSNHQSSPQVRVSIVSLPPAPLAAAAQASGITQQQTTGQNSAATTNGQLQQLTQQQDSNNISSGCTNGQGGDRICFNIGKELYVYSFKGIRKVTIHDFSMKF